VKYVTSSHPILYIISAIFSYFSYCLNTNLHPKLVVYDDDAILIILTAKGSGVNESVSVLDHRAGFEGPVTGFSVRPSDRLPSPLSDRHGRP
jgi:hypothetical protein